MNVTSDSLSYVDSERKAVFSGKVVLRGDELTMNADTVNVLLQARGNQNGKGGSQLDRIVAQGDIMIEQPERKARGSQVGLYRSRSEKIVLTGSCRTPA